MPYHEGKKVKFKRRTAGWNPGEWETGRVGGRGKHGRWGVLKGCEPVEIGGGGEDTRQSSIFRNRQKGYIEEAKKKRGGSRKCKVREVGIWTPMPPPPPQR